MEFIIRDYVDKMTENDINNFALKESINLTDDERRTIYMYIKNYWRVFLKEDPTYLFEELKEKLSPSVYQKTLELYNKYKRK